MKNEERDAGYFGCGEGHDSEAERTGDQREQEKHQRVVKHGKLLSLIAIFAPTLAIRFRAIILMQVCIQ